MVNQVDTIVHGGLRISVLRLGDKRRVSFEGIFDFQKPEKILSPLFNDILEEDISHLSVEFAELELLTSSTVPLILDLIVQLEARKIEGVIIYDGNLKWQTTTFKILKDVSNLRRIRYVTIRPKAPN